ncbi:MAG: extracellular solute-binding protein [Pseudomonadota bacterium]
MYFLKCITRLTFLISYILYIKCASAEQVITLATGERIPYIGKSLSQNGYVAELVTTALARQGYRVNIEFYPWARTLKLAQEGKVDGALPLFKEIDPKISSSFIYSKPFPGDIIGLLKKKSLQLHSSAKERESSHSFLASLKGYSVGMVRGGISLPMIDNASFLDKQMVSTDVQNLDKLNLGRIQFALIDKYTAADLITSQLPHLIGNFEFMAPPLAERDFFIGFSSRLKHSQQLADAFNAGLDKITRDGTLEKILKKHGLFTQKKEAHNKTHLTIGTVNNNDMKIMQTLSNAFEKDHPDIELEWRVLDENTLRLRLLSDLAIADGQFDIMTIGTYEAPIWAKQKWLMPLSLQDNYDLNDILPTVRAGFSYEGQLFALPFYAESSMMFYRKDLFSKAGITMPESPTYEDVMKFASKIHHPETGVYGVCLRGKAGWGENMAFLTTLANAFGGRWFDEQWNPELNSAPWEKALNFYKQLMTQYGPPNLTQNGFNENLQLFLNGKCGMWIDATVAAGMLFDPKQSKVWNQLGYVKAPAQVTSKGAAWLWGWGLAIPNTSSHKKEATQFISWATSKGYIHTVAKNYGWVQVPPGTRLSTYKNENYLKAAPFAKFVLNAVEHANIKDSTLKPKPYLGIQYVSIPEFPAIGHQVGLEVAKAMQGEQSIQQALMKAQEKTLLQMKNSGYIK